MAQATTVKRTVRSDTIQKSLQVLRGADSRHLPSSYWFELGVGANAVIHMVVQWHCPAASSQPQQARSSRLLVHLWSRTTLAAGVCETVSKDSFPSARTDTIISSGLLALCLLSTTLTCKQNPIVW